MGMLLRRHRKARGLAPDTEPEAAEPDLSEMTKAELVELAEDLGLEVSRSDGTDGAPLREDYEAALREAAEGGG